MTIKNLIISLLFLSSCSYISGPEGYFPSKQYDFIEEKIEEPLKLPDDRSLASLEDHYPVADYQDTSLEIVNIPRPRQVFSSAGNSSVQLRRLGDLMWVYVETLPSTSWPIMSSYWDTSKYEVISKTPNTGVIKIEFDENSILEMQIEHGIKESSTEIFLNQVSNNNNEYISNPELIQSELETVVNFFAESINTFSGTSLAAQNLNDLKKSKIFLEKGQTVIELDLNIDRAWSSVTKAINESNIILNDKDRNNGIFYVSNNSSDRSRGIFSFLKRSNKIEKNDFAIGAFEFEVRITQKNNKTYVRAYSKNGNIEDSEQLISLINESLS
ncbi:outer membrane protein assembly factor BamC [Gammaproteobacteria bacterium]|nr:outer membrane protein assembly factor BamC [Gammaproteobacteria bacterium]